MTPSKNKTIYTVDCFICKRENHQCELKHFNNNKECKIYCRCTCGGELKLPNNQEFFKEMLNQPTPAPIPTQPTPIPPTPNQPAPTPPNPPIIDQKPPTEKSKWDTIL